MGTDKRVGSAYYLNWLFLFCVAKRVSKGVKFIKEFYNTGNPPKFPWVVQESFCSNSFLFGGVCFFLKWKTFWRWLHEKRKREREKLYTDRIGRNQSSGCGAVGRAVASDTRDPRFESSHLQNFICQLYNRKDQNKEKEAGNGPSLKKSSPCTLAVIGLFRCDSSIFRSLL